MTQSIIEQPAMLPAAALTELKALLAIENVEDDALLFSHLRTAYALCEAFTGRPLLMSRRRYPLALRTGVQYLPDAPVMAIEDVRLVDADSLGAPLPITRYRMDIGADGRGEVALLAPLPDQPVAVRYVIGTAHDWNELAEPLRHGIIRLAAHQHLHGLAEDNSAPPMVIAALWRPWRRMRLA